MMAVYPTSWTAMVPFLIIQYVLISGMTEIQLYISITSGFEKYINVSLGDNTDYNQLPI